jgi:Smg protein
VVVERVLALEEDEIDLEQLKWVVLMVLFYQPGREVAYAWMEDLVFEDMEAVIH